MADDRGATSAPPRKTLSRIWPAGYPQRRALAINPDQRRELAEMAQRLEDWIAERADERAMIAGLEQALADLQVLAADKSAPEVKLAIQAAGRLASPLAK